MFKKIIKQIKDNYYIYTLVVICLIAFVLYFPSLKNFYTNDDFFHLRISQINSVKEFFNFFNLVKSPEGWGLYRPLTTQVFYFLTVKFFNLNPVPLHIISFLTFFAIIFLVAEFVKMITKNKSIAILAAFLYATSATHFGHLYFLGAYQELGMTLFFLLSVISFYKFELTNKTKYLIFSLFYFIFALTSKETAVILPFIIVLVHLYLLIAKEKVKSLKEFIFSVLPFFVLLSLYLFMRLKYYGFAQGDSYVWDFSIKRALNTLVWYKLWSFNIPETLVDFVGPGLRLNPNLFKYWGSQFRIIFSLFAAQIIILFLSVFSKYKNILKNWRIYLFIAAWFVLTLIPVLFLPVHKFTYYLTLPLIGISVCISILLINFKFKKTVYIFMMIWLCNSYISLKLTENTNWITQGAKTSKNVYRYFEQNNNKYINKDIYFYDTEEDKELPFSPTSAVKLSVSDNNFFQVYYPDITLVSDELNSNNIEKIRSRMFLGY